RHGVPAVTSAVERGGAVAAILEVEGGIRRTRLEARRLDPGGRYAHTDADIRACYVVPRHPVVSRHLDDAVDGPNPDDAGPHGRCRDRPDARATSNARVARGRVGPGVTDIGTHLRPGPPALR